MVAETNTQGVTFSVATTSSSPETQLDTALFDYGLSASDKENLVEIGDDVLVHTINNPIGFMCGCVITNQVFIYSNGYITLQQQYSSNIPRLFPSTYTGVSKIIAPFWTDISIGADTHIWYNFYNKFDGYGNSTEFLNKTKVYLKDNFQDSSQLENFEPNTALKVTWEHVYPNPADGANATFQLILVSNGTATFTVFLFGNLNWPSTVTQPIASSWQCSENGHYNHPASLDPSLPLEIKGASNSRNQNLKGSWFYRVDTFDTCAVTTVNYVQRCYQWLANQDKLYSNTWSEYNKILSDCPCNLNQAQRDPKFYQGTGTNTTNCYYTQYAPSKTLGARKCCYSSTSLALLTDTAESGYLMLYHPLHDSVNNSKFDIQPLNDCCVQAGLCAQFFERRPSKNCDNYKGPILALTAGDPHITTLDNKHYTYNGLGEYVLLHAELTEGYFMLQTRTLQAIDSNGTAITATIFGGFAAKDDQGATFQVELTENRTDMILRINQVDSTVRFNTEDNFRIQDSNIVVDKISSQSVRAFFTKSGIAIEVTLRVKMLDNRIILPENLKGSSKFQGLLGNVNGDPDDDFQLPNGTILSPTLTESEIYDTFGEEWRTNGSSSIFHYEPGFSNSFYQDKSFKPFFLDSFNEMDLTEARTVCGSLNNTECVFDYLALGKNEAVANNTKVLLKNVEVDIKSAANLIPKVIGPRRINATVNESFDITVKSYDANNENVTVYFSGLITQQSVGKPNDTLTATYTPNQSINDNIRYYAVDESSGISSLETITIYLCPGCGKNGTCDYSLGTADSSSQVFYNVQCQCDTGYTGDKCEKDVDGCADNPCPDMTTCTDKTPEEQLRDKVLYSCSDCAAGYKLVAGKCTDVNECNNATTCEQYCTNNVGGYTCSCYNGYRLVGGQCLDVDECSESTSKCNQICTNTEGSYNCSCRDGFILQSDTYTCIPDPTYNTTLCNAKGCSSGCTVNNSVAQCFCSLGYKLDSDGTTCIDINECTDSVAYCPQVCTNVLGSYTCSCYVGYKLQEDKTSCKECSSLFYGQDCTKRCDACSPNTKTCDRVKGCICKEGWTGATCNTDIDECQTLGRCSSLEKCANTFGSYDCVCKEGYEKGNTNKCQDKNECATGLNDCDKNADCINQNGGYVCSCKKGYKGDGLSCTDVDECLGTNDCQQNCENAVGSYNCFCNAGFILNSDRKNCNKIKIFEGIDKCDNLTCAAVNGGCSINETGGQSAYCFCDKGFTLVADNNCTDTNECLSNNGGCEQNCTNNAGGFSCSCNTGYRLSSDGKSCDACNATDSWGDNCANRCNCGIGAKFCDSVDGCVCKEGYNGTTCTENINECKLNPSPCINNQTCVDTEGSYICTCADGFTLENNYCVDKDECNSANDNTCNQRCINVDISNTTTNGYLCSCEDGFELNENNTCQNIDECKFLDNNCEQLCVDTSGSFYCSCRPGFVLSSDQSSCKRVEDKCASYGDSCSYGCEVVNGEPVCFCRQNYELDELDNTTCSVVYNSITFDIKTDYPWNSNLADVTTNEFKHTRVDITPSLKAYYENQTTFVSLIINEFSSGSTQIKYTVMFSGNLTNDIIEANVNITDGIQSIKELNVPYNVIGEKNITYQGKDSEPIGCTKCTLLGQICEHVNAEYLCSEKSIVETTTEIGSTTETELGSSITATELGSSVTVTEIGSSITVTELGSSVTVAELSSTSTSAKTTTVSSTDTGSTEWILGLGIGLPLAIIVLIIAIIIIICMCRLKTGSRSFNDSRRYSENLLPHGFGKLDPSLAGKARGDVGGTVEGYFGTQYQQRWSRDPYYREPPYDGPRPYFGPGDMADFGFSQASSSEDMNIQVTPSAPFEVEDDFGETNIPFWLQIMGTSKDSEELRLPRPQVDELPSNIYTRRKDDRKFSDA